MRYINPRFTYLLTYLLTAATTSCVYPFTAHLVLWWAEVNLNVTNFYTQNSIQGLRILQQYSSVRGDHSGGSLARFSIFRKYSRLLAFL